MTPLHGLGVAELGRALADKSVSSVEVIGHLLGRIAAHDGSVLKRRSGCFHSQYLLLLRLLIQEHWFSVRYW